MDLHEKQCCICGSSYDIYFLKMYDADFKFDYRKPVCGNCWNVIGKIAENVVKSILEKYELKEKDNG